MKTLNYDKCVEFALKQNGIEGKTFNDTDLRVFHRRIANPGSIFAALGKQGIIIPTVSSSLWGGSDDELTATVLVKVNQVKDEVYVYVPAREEVCTFSIDDFFDAWERAGGDCTTAFKQDARTYSPKLIDLKHVKLPDDYAQLQEAIAENAHDTWALERQSEGWTYGIRRNDAALETPDMVPYGQLPESEKQYDRLMAADTLKLLIALGYKIEKKA